MKELWKQIRTQGIESFGRFYGVYLGVVQDNEDPNKANRLLVNIPDIMGYGNNVRMALPRMGIMGDGYGIHFLPKKNAIVTITFRNGDVDHPFWEPGPYPNNGAPPEFEGPDIMGLRSRTGHIVAIDDKNNTILVQHKDGYYFEIKESQITLGNKERIVIKDNQIQLGKADSLEPAVLGDSLKDLLKKLIEEIQQLKTVDSTPMNADNIAKLEIIKQTLPNILASFNT